MAKEKPCVKLAIANDPRTRALIEGKVGVEGYELEIIQDAANSGERHYRFVRGEFDVGEYSTATLLRGREKGLGFLGLPVFLDRGPCQRNIFHCEGKLTHPGELKGKKIGCFRYGATAVVWARGFLLDEYGLKTTDMDWYVSGQEVYIGQELPVEIERPNPPAPFGQERSHLAQRLSEGTLDIAIVAGDFGYLGIFGGGFLPGDMGKFPGVKPLLEDTDEIIRYIRNKRIYPMIHTIAIKQETAQRYPDLPAKLIEAFREAKKVRFPMRRRRFRPIASTLRMRVPMRSRLEKTGSGTKRFLRENSFRHRSWIVRRRSVARLRHGSLPSRKRSKKGRPSWSWCGSKEKRCRLKRLTYRPARQRCVRQRRSWKI